MEYHQILQEEINNRYTRSKIIYKFVSIIHLIKIILIGSFLYYNPSYNEFASWLIIYGIITVIHNFIYMLKINLLENNYILKFEYLIYLCNICWYLYGINLVYNKTYYPLSELVLGFLIYEFIVILIIILLNFCLCCTGCIILIARHNLINYISDNTGLQEEEINSIPVNKYGEIEDTNIIECPICLTEFNNDDFIRQFDCKHIFHKECIDVWLRLKDNCPMCRQAILQDYEYI